MRKRVAVGLALASVGLLVGSMAAIGWAQGRSALSGRVKIDGSSTVAPIMMATAELFMAEQPRVQVNVGISGSGGGFKKFLESRADLRTDISDASRPITEAELRRAAEVGVDFLELPIAYDGISVVVHPSNTACDHLTVDELRRIWQPGSTINNWKDIRQGLPDLPLHLYGPGMDSGTFDYFTGAIVGKARACRSDFTPSENDNVLVEGVAGDPGGLGYFGYSYYEANKDKLRLVGIDDGSGKPVKPSLETIRSGQYKPLSRPLFVYVNRQAADRPEVRALLDFFLRNPRAIVEHPKVNYVALSDPLYAAVRARLEAKRTGSVFADTASPSKSLEQLYGVKPSEP
jgi:phosphate transport system substrate-binding protein